MTKEIKMITTARNNFSKAQTYLYKALRTIISKEKTMAFKPNEITYQNGYIKWVVYDSATEVVTIAIETSCGTKLCNDFECDLETINTLLKAIGDILTERQLLPIIQKMEEYNYKK